VTAILLGEPWPVVAFTAVAEAGVAFLHRANIRRLFAGTEPRFKFTRPSLRRRAPST
jgi:glycerol-3-phosphate acyltransferase PlsY